METDLKGFERAIWAAVALCLLGALGFSVVSARDLQKAFDREQYLHIVGTAGLVSNLERGEVDQAIRSGRLYLHAYGSAYDARNRQRNVFVTDAEHEKVMDLLDSLSVSLPN